MDDQKTEPLPSVIVSFKSYEPINEIRKFLKTVSESNGLTYTMWRSLDEAAQFTGELYVSPTHTFDVDRSFQFLEESESDTDYVDQPVEDDDDGDDIFEDGECPVRVTQKEIETYMEWVSTDY